MQATIWPLLTLDAFFLQSFERWGKLAGSAAAQLTDLFPMMQSLPRLVAPGVREAEGLHEKEKDLYVRLWMRAKRGLEDGTGHVGRLGRP